jgi:Domain of unknown function (DUF1851)
MACPALLRVALECVNLRDYIIDPSGIDWQALLGEWAGLLPDEFNFWMATRFGDLIVICNDGSIGFFNVGNLTFEKVAASPDEFAERMNTERNAQFTFMSSLVESCVGRGMVPGPGQCYAFKIPPFLGGQYEMSNMYVADIAEYHGFLADLWRQTKNLSDGSQVRLVVK